MIIHSIIKSSRTLLPLCVSAAVAVCSCSGAENGPLDNPFDNPLGDPAVEAEYTSCADTVFLSWKLVKDVVFDSYKVSDQYGKNSVTLGKDATECALTHIPYNERVNISVVLMSGDKTVNTTAVPVQIDGLDPVIASKIIPDKGSVVEGDGMYSVDLGDGRSIFLMGDSYIGEVSGGRRTSGDHMYRNTYSVYDHAKQTSYGLAEVNGPNTSAAVPAGVTDEGSRWYWPGHGFVVGNNLYIFQQVMFSGDGPAGWNFYYDETHILQYSLPDLPLKPVRDAAFRCCRTERSGRHGLPLYLRADGHRERYRPGHRGVCGQDYGSGPFLLVGVLERQLMVSGPELRGCSLRPVLCPCLIAVQCIQTGGQICPHSPEQDMEQRRDIHVHFRQSMGAVGA